MSYDSVPKKIAEQISIFEKNIREGSLRDVRSLKFLLKKYNLFNNRDFKRLVLDGKKASIQKRNEFISKFYKDIDSLPTLRFTDSDFKQKLVKWRDYILSSESPLEYSERLSSFIAYLEEMDLYSKELVAKVLGKENLKEIISSLAQIKKSHAN